MTTWNDLQTYVRSTYKVADDQATFMKLIFTTEGMRSQVVFLWREVLGDGTEEWVSIQSPIGEIGKMDTTALLRAVGDMVVGGVGVVGDLAVFKHAVPLAGMDALEFERPLALVTVTADRLEAQFVGGDEY